MVRKIAIGLAAMAIAMGGATSASLAQGVGGAGPGPGSGGGSGYGQPGGPHGQAGQPGGPHGQAGGPHGRADKCSNRGAFAEGCMESRNAGKRLGKSSAEDLARSRRAQEQRHEAEVQRAIERNRGWEEKFHQDAEWRRRQMGR